MWLPAVVVFSLCFVGALCADPRKQFVHRLLSMYQSSMEQAKAADRDSDGAISENEFLQTLFLFADTDVRDRRVTQAEFMDGYRRYYALPSELLVIMFDLLDDLNDDGGTRPNMDFRDNRNNQYFQLYFQFARGNNVFQNNHRNQGDGVLTSRDVTYQMFVGNNNSPNMEDFQKALMSWVDEAANRLYTINYQPHIPGNPWDREFDYELWFHNVDRNNDSLISFGELRDELWRYSSDGRVSRSRWTERNLQVYDDKEWLTNVVFDAWDKNRDLRLDDLDAGLVLREADQNQDRRVTTVELHRFMERYNKLARRRLATPVRPVIFDCPSPWWQSFGCRPRVDATRAAMDMDDNFDGWITPREFGKRISYYDRNGDGWASRFEVISMETLRYGVSGPAASVMFDIYDRNSDDRYDHLDLQFILPEGGLLCFCDARKAVLDLVRLAERFRFSPQARGPVGSMRNAMRWQLAREWTWRDRNKNIWRWLTGQSPWPWGAGGCKEGDCTGRDWRGTGWYSPFDWRQRNRVPENFLQWSYLHDVPRTIFLPPGFQGRAYPGDWWNQPWRYNFPGSGAKGRPDGDRDEDGGSSFGGDIRMPSFPSPTWLTEGSSFDDLWNFSGDNNDTDTPFTGPGTFWSNPNSNFWEQMFRQGGPLPSWLTSGRTDTSSDQRKPQVPWFLNWDPSLPSRPSRPDNSLPSNNRPGNSRPGNSRPVNTDDQKGASSPLNRFDNKYRPQTTTVASVASRPTGQGGPASTGSNAPASSLPSSRVGMGHQDVGARFRREAAPEEEVNQTSAESLAPPPSLVDSNVTSANDTNLSFAREFNSTINETDLEENSTRSDENKDLAEEKDEIARALARNSRPSSQSHWWDSVTWTNTGDTMPGYGEWSGASNDRQDSTTEHNAWNSNPGWDNSWVSNYYGESPTGSTRPTQSYWSNTYPGYTNGGALSYNSWPVWRSYENYSPQLNGYSGYNYQFHPNGQNARWGNYWNTQGNEGPFYPSIYSFYSHYGQPAPDSYNRHLGLWKRNADSKQDSSTVNKQTSRMMGDFSTYWPWWEWWNFYNNAYNTYQPWSSNWNVYNSNRWFPWYSGRQWNYNWFSNHHGSPYLFSRTNENHDASSDIKLKVKRSVNNENDLKSMDESVSRWTVGYQPQWWNQYNGMGTRRSGDEISSVANIWNWNWNWFFNQNMLRSYSPMFLRSVPYIQGTQQPMKSVEQARIYRRSTESRPTEEVSRSMNGPSVRWWTGWDSYWPYWWNSNTWSSYWPDGNYWKSYNPAWNSYAWQGPYSGYRFSRKMPSVYKDQHDILKRSADNKDQASRQMGGWDWPQHWRSYWPQWWNRNPWNTYLYDWSGRMWNSNQGFSPYDAFSFLRNENGRSPDGNHTPVRRSTRESPGGSDTKDDENGKVSRMLGRFWSQRDWNGYNYWPQQFLSGYSYWPQRWGGYPWNRYWPGWNSWNNNNWIWNTNEASTPLFPVYDSQGQPHLENSQSQEQIVKRSADGKPEEQEKDVSRMMASYGAFWPHKNMDWPQNWSGYSWNSNWPARGLNSAYIPFNPPYFPQGQQTPGSSQGCAHDIFKRSAAESREENANKEGREAARMIGFDNMLMPQELWPRWNTDSWAWNGRSSFFPYNYYNYQRNMGIRHPPYHPLFRRHAEENLEKESLDEDKKTSKMMNGHDWYWPQGWSSYDSPQWWKWNMWNNFWNTRNQNSRTWNGGREFYPYSLFYFPDTRVLFKRSTEDQQAEKSSDNVSRMMGMYEGFFPQQYWNPYSSLNQWWNRDIYWPKWSFKWTPWASTSFGTSMFPRGEDFHSRFSRSVDQTQEGSLKDQEKKVSNMMGGFGSLWPQYWSGYSNWPQWWRGYNKWNNYWPGWKPYDFTWNRNQPFYPYNPFYYSQGGYRPEVSPDFTHDIFKRSTEENAQHVSQDKDENVSRLMGGYNGFWPQSWRSFTYRPRWWNPYYNWNDFGQGWNPYDWTWNRNQPFYPYNPYYYSQGGYRPEVSPDFTHDIFKRSTDEETQHVSQEKDKNVSRMMGGYNGFWPQSGSSYTYWPRWWTGNYNWKNYWPEWNTWNMYNWMGNKDSSYPYYSFHERFSRGADKQPDHEKHEQKTVSRMMGGSGLFWPHPFWNRHMIWPQWWNSRWANNYDWMRNYNQGYNPYSDFSSLYYGAQASPSSDDGHLIFRRSIVQDLPLSSKSENVSRMTGGYWPYYNWKRYNYLPQWWNQNSWRNMQPGWSYLNWLWSMNYNFYPPNYFPSSVFGTSPFSSPDDEIHTVLRRSLDKKQEEKPQENDKQTSRMAGQDVWYPAHIYWNNFNFWPQWWREFPWNRYWPGWNNYNWMGSRNVGETDYTPYQFAKSDVANSGHEKFRRSSEADHKASKNFQESTTSRMMGGYEGYWPQQNWYGSRYWPLLDNGYEWGRFSPAWRNSWMWNTNPGYFLPNPLYYSRESHPLGGTFESPHALLRRSADNNQDHAETDPESDVSRMMGRYPEFWPSQSWNRNYYPYLWWNRNSFWPAWSNSWMWNYNQQPYDPFAFANSQPDADSSFATSHEITRRESSDKQEDSPPEKNKTSRMMGGFAWFRPYNYWNIYNYWPQWWSQNFWNSHQYELNSWNGNNWMWNRNPDVFFNYPSYYYSLDGQPPDSNHHSVFRRSAETNNGKNLLNEHSRTSKMLGGYLPLQDWNSYRFWPQWWSGYQWNWNMYRPDWNSWNNFDRFWRFSQGYNPENLYSFSRTNSAPGTSPETGHTVSKRSSDEKQDTNAEGKEEQTSKWISGYSRDWPQWWNLNMWVNYWPYWNSWNRWPWRADREYSAYNPYVFSQRHDIFRRSAEKLQNLIPQEGRKPESQMMNGYWPPADWSTNQYWSPSWGSYPYSSPPWGRNWWNSYGFGQKFNPIWSSDPLYSPFYRFSFSKENARSASSSEKTHSAFRRSLDESEKEVSQDQDQKTSRMLGWYGWNWPQTNWNNNYWWPWWQDRNAWNSYNWMWSKNRVFFPYSPFLYSQRDAQPVASDIYHAMFKRSTDSTNANGFSKDGAGTAKMMGEGSGYWPQQWGSNPNNWPWWWVSNRWNNYWPGWNNYAWMWRTYDSWYPLHSYQFSKKNEQSGHETDDKHPISKRSPNEDNLDEKKGSLGRWTNAENFWTLLQNNNPYLPWQETDMWNSYTRWPYWNTFNQAWNNWNIFNNQGRYPYGHYFYSKGANHDSSDKESMLTKRDTAQGNQGQSSGTVSGPNLMDLLKKNIWQLPNTRDADKPQQPPVSKRSAEGSQKNKKEEDMGRQMNGDRRDSRQFERSWPQSDTYDPFRSGFRAGYFIPNKWNDDMSDNNNHFWNRDPLWRGLNENNAQLGSFSMDNEWNVYNRPMQNYWAGYNNWGPFRNEFRQHPYFVTNSQMWSDNVDFGYQKGADGSSEKEADVRSSDSENEDRTKRSANDNDASEHIARQRSSYERLRSFPYWWNGYIFRRPNFWNAYGPWNSLYYMWRNWPRNQMWNDQTPESYWMWNNLWTNNNDQNWNSVDGVNWNTLNPNGMTNPQFLYQHQQNLPNGVEAEEGSSAPTKKEKLSKRSTDEDQASVSKEDEVGKQLGGYNSFPSYIPWSRSWRGFYWPRWFGNRNVWNRWNNYPSWYNYYRWNNWNWQPRPTWNIQTQSPESLWNIDVFRPTWDGLNGQIPQYFTTPVPSMSTTAETRQKQNPTTTSRVPRVEPNPEPEHRTTLSKRSTLSDQDRDIFKWVDNPRGAGYRNFYSQWPQWMNTPNYYDPRRFPVFVMQNGQNDPLRDNRAWDAYFRGFSAPNFFQFSKTESADSKNTHEFERVVKRRSVEEQKQTTGEPEIKIKDPGVSRWLSDIFRTRELFRPEWRSTSFGRPWQYTPYSFVNRNINYFPWWAYRNWYSPAWYNQRLWSNSWMWSPLWQYDDAWQEFQQSGPGSVLDASQLWNGPGDNEGFFPGNYWSNIDSTWGDLSPFGPSAGADDEVQFTGAPEIRQQKTGDNGGSGQASSDDGGIGDIKESSADSTQHSLTKRSHDFVVRNTADKRGSLRASRWLDRRRVMSKGATAKRPRWRRSAGSLRQRKSLLDLQRFGWMGNLGQEHKPYWLSGSWEVSGNNQPWSKWMRWNKWNGGFVWNDHLDTFGGSNPFQSFSRTGSSSELKDDNIQKRSAESPASSQDTGSNKKSQTGAARWMSGYSSNSPMGMNLNLQSYLPWQSIMGFNDRDLLKSGPEWYNFVDSQGNFRPFHAPFPAAQTAYDNPIFPRKKRAAVPPDQDVVAVEPESTTEQMFSKWMNEYSHMPSNWHLWMKNRWPMLNYDFLPGWTNSYQSMPAWGNIGWDKSSLNGNPAWNYQPWNSKDLHENYWGNWNNHDILYSLQSSEGKVNEQEGDKDRLDRSSAHTTPTENGATPRNSEHANPEIDATPVNSEGMRARRSALNLAAVLSKGVLHHKNTLKSNSVSSRKDSLGPRKFKRFSAEATARLQNRLQKRLAPTEASRAVTERTTSSSSELGNVKSDARKGTSTPALDLAEGRASEALSGKTVPGQEPLDGNGFYNRNPSSDRVQPRPPNGEVDLTKGGERGEGTVTPTRFDSGNNDAMLSEYNYYDQDSQKWLNVYNPYNHNSSTSSWSQSNNTSQWNDWMQLWAYGPNFWDSLDSWDGYPFGMAWNAGGMNFNPWSNPPKRYGEFGSNLPNIGLTGCSGHRNYIGPPNYDVSLRKMAHDYVSSVSDLYRDLWDDNCDSIYDRGMSLNPGVNQILYASFGPAQTWWDLLTGPTSHSEGLRPWYDVPGYKSHSPLLQDSCCDRWFEGTKYGHGIPVGVLPTWSDSGLNSRLQDAFEWRFPWQWNQFRERNAFENTQLPGRQPQESSSGARVFSDPWNDSTKIKNWQPLNNFWNAREGQKRMGSNQNWNYPAFNQGLEGAGAANPWATDAGRYMKQEAPASPWNRDSDLSNQPNRWPQQRWQSPGNQGDGSSWNSFGASKDGATFSRGSPSSTDATGFGDPGFGPSSPLASAPSPFEESSTGVPSFISSVFPRPGPRSYLDSMTTRASSRLDSPISTPTLEQAGMAPDFNGEADYISPGSQPLTQFQKPTDKDC